MGHTIEPLRAERFMKAALEYLEEFKGTRIYEAAMRGYMEKTEQIDAGYGRWLQHLLTYLVRHFNLGEHPRILDLGCGTGELVVRMNLLGFRATGMDLHEKHLELAQILAEENGLSSTLFVFNKSDHLPFEEGSFDIVTMFSVLEHINDATLKWLLPELSRVCCGVVYVLVPNKLKPRDDHTGLRFVSYLPRWLAVPYIKLRGQKHRYFISECGSWDVYHRSLGRVAFLFKRCGFKMNFPADGVIYPSLEQCPPILRIGKSLRLGKRDIFVGVPLPHRLMIRLGYPKQIFYPYLNLVFVPPK